MNQATWSVVLSFGTSGVKLLVQDDGDDVLKAMLPGNVGHPRALVTVRGAGAGSALLRMWTNRERAASTELSSGASPPDPRAR